MKTILGLLIIFLCPSPLNAKRVLFVLPDDNFIMTECMVLQREAHKNYRERLEDYRGILEDVHRLCGDVKKKIISPDNWVKKINNIAIEIENSRCPNCVSAFVLSSIKPVPKGFSTYVLALIPSPDLVEDFEWIREFERKYVDFGASIGNRKAAIWFRDRYSKDIDISRSKYYCDLFNLNYNDGPYLVVTNKRPDLYGYGDEIVFVKLNNISKKRVLKVLNILEQDLRKERDIRKRALLYAEVKQRLFTISERYGEEIKDIVVSWLKK